MLVRICLVVVTTMLGLFAPAQRSEAIEIVYPADGTVAQRSNYLIIKAGTNPRVDSLVVGLNGAETDPIDISGEEYRAVFQDILILQPEFDEGINKITARAYVRGEQVGSAAAEIYYQVDPSETVPNKFKPFNMHLPEKEAICAPCHNMNPTKDEFDDVDPKTNPCLACHKGMLNRTYVHGPAGVARCAFCHDKASSPRRYVVKARDRDLCVECHDDQVARFSDSEFVHGPVAAGLCSICHDSHASNNPGQLHLPINQLCLNCHAEVKGKPHVTRSVGAQRSHPLDGETDPSTGKALSCVSCHDPHSGAASRYFVGDVKSQFGLCQRCHKK